FQKLRIGAHERRADVLAAATFLLLGVCLAGREHQAKKSGGEGQVPRHPHKGLQIRNPCIPTKIRNPNIEIRNELEIRNHKSQTRVVFVSIFEFRICFGFRISSFGFLLSRDRRAPRYDPVGLFSSFSLMVNDSSPRVTCSVTSSFGLRRRRTVFTSSWLATALPSIWAMMSSTLRPARSAGEFGAITLILPLFLSNSSITPM